jgi:hypothetical protein
MRHLLLFAFADDLIQSTVVPLRLASSGPQPFEDDSNSFFVFALICPCRIVALHTSILPPCEPNRALTAILPASPAATASRGQESSDCIPEDTVSNRRHPVHPFKVI